MLGAAKITPSISNPTSVDEEAKKKTKIQNAIKQFIHQLKTGCNKAICFNKYCRKNKFEQDKLIFKDDRELLKWSLDVLKNSNDPDELICSQTKTLCRSDLKFTTDDDLKRLIEDSHAFCASFQDM